MKEAMAELQQAILLMTELLQKLAQPNNTEQTLESLATNISEFSFDPENGITFEKWYSRYTDLFESDAKNLDDSAKVRLLLRKLDTPSHVRYVNFILPKLPKDVDFAGNVKILSQMFGTHTSIFNKRYKCLQLVKSEAEDIISYAGKVNRSCEDFDFKNMNIDQFKCLVFVSGLKGHAYADTRPRLLSRIECETAETPVNLQTLINEYQRLVNLKEDTSMIERQSSSKQAVHAVQEKGRFHHPHTSKRKTVPGGGEKKTSNQSPSNQPSNQQTNQPANRQNNPRKVNARGVYIVNHIVNHIANRSSNRKYVPTLINGVATRLQLDTASDITVISKQTWNNLGNLSIIKPTIQAINASGKPLHLMGEFQCDVSINGKTARGRCFVTTTANLNLLGIDWIDLFKLCAQSLSTPFHWSMLNSHDYNLWFEDPVDFSEWAAPIVAVRKPNGRVRICADYSTGLNEALEPNHYPLPTPEEIFAQLNGSTVFSIVYLSDAYLQLEVDDDSKKLLTINTHRGLFRFNRLAPGVKSAPGVFQRVVDGMIADIPGVRSFIDDVIVFGKDISSHATSLNLLFQRLKEYGFHVKAEKCHFFQSQLGYLGHIVDKQGIRPDPEKVKAIAALPPPTNVPELRSYLGAVNFYGRFVRNIHELRHPMDQLLKKDVKWQWTPACQQAFDQFKRTLQSNLLLMHYDPKLPIIVAADASSTGIGAVIFHQFPDGSMKAVQHASRTLAPAELNYGQPEKEALALVYAVTKFHKYLLGRHFTLLTDHKPLLSIFGSMKGIPLHTANRLQRWALTMLNYDFEIQHVSTNEFGCADLLSRLIDQTIQPEEEYVIAALSIEEDLHCKRLQQPTPHSNLLLNTYATDGPAAPRTFPLQFNRIFYDGNRSA
ncbi:uncharacterized protein K02A2.6-like [Anopheles merus]|uniref:uncharacterized protein K02A2.6-like n=1 Tax=Anopheles merus TaxID=30066 RepID=UPI001BE45723|nr:uncharacterized protein K02A2.6-like [Anopheles merus]